jgi:hypothetical protein
LSDPFLPVLDQFCVRGGGCLNGEEAVDGLRGLHLEQVDLHPYGIHDDDDLVQTKMSSSEMLMLGVSSTPVLKTRKSIAAAVAVVAVVQARLEKLLPTPK